MRPWRCWIVRCFRRCPKPNIPGDSNQISEVAWSWKFSTTLSWFTEGGKKLTPASTYVYLLNPKCNNHIQHLHFGGFCFTLRYGDQAYALILTSIWLAGGSFSWSGWVTSDDPVEGRNVAGKSVPSHSAVGSHPWVLRVRHSVRYNRTP